LQVIDKALIGQNLDLTAAPKDGVSFAKFTNERFSKIAHYKTAYFCFYLPVACAMYMVRTFSLHFSSISVSYF